MSRTFTDEDLLTWEAFATGGDLGLAIQPRIVFHCLSDPSRRPRFVQRRGDEADAEGLVHEIGEDRLRALLGESQELD